MAVGSLAVTAAPNPARTYGVLTVEGHIAHKKQTGEDLHVYLDGKDVTTSCYEASDVDGYVKLFCRDPQHHVALDRQGAIHLGGDGLGVCQMRLDGRVVIAPGAKL